MFYYKVLDSVQPWHIITELTHSKTILENTVESEP